MFCRSLFVLLYFFFWPLCCLFFFDIRILITSLVSSNSSCVPNVSSISALSIIDYLFGIFKLFLCAQCFQYLSIVHYWLPLWYLQALLVCPMFTVSQHCPLLITPLVSSNYSCVPNVSSSSALSIIDYPFGIFKLFLCAQCFQYLSIVHYWLPLRYLQALLVFPMFPVAQHCPLLITSLVSSNSSCVPNVSSISALSIIDYLFGIFKFFLCAQCFQYLSIVYYRLPLWYLQTLLVCPMFPVS